MSNKKRPSFKYKIYERTESYLLSGDEESKRYKLVVAPNKLWASWAALIKKFGIAQLQEPLSSSDDSYYFHSLDSVKECLELFISQERQAYESQTIFTSKIIDAGTITV